MTAGLTEIGPGFYRSFHATIVRYSKVIDLDALLIA